VCVRERETERDREKERERERERERARESERERGREREPLVVNEFTSTSCTMYLVYTVNEASSAT